MLIRQRIEILVVISLVAYNVTVHFLYKSLFERYLLQDSLVDTVLPPLLPIFMEFLS